MRVNVVAILGVGLIGGSLARALKRARFCGTVTGFGRNRATLQKAESLGVIDASFLDPARAVEGADIVVLAAPVSATEDLCRRITPALKDGAIITDVGSAKGPVVEAARRGLSAAQFANFVPAHPIAGGEQSGVEHSLAHLFDDHLVILTPVAETSIRALELIRTLWQECRARVTSLPVDRHDRILAGTSHLPHVLAYALVDCLSGMQGREQIFEYAAGGFADFTRIASSNPRMWHDICLSNREELLKVLDAFDVHLDRVRTAIESGDSPELLKIFSRAKQARDEFIDRRKREQ